ncbi:maltooligosyl trehalose hydrolase [Pontibacter ummariensis]|uniref:Malto-oligosyltrehalose trehalohydrolase n=1 Tax=Pontibacter ummariensis TaxID=1610492 RepID=A0A239IRA9_9BACT|nr:malto-oligosyltrehalose trehalohydrolase [Pontibacter ummariensis]PRY09728.1 maltooligosyl trehalose hydrolase [Pontibacter ummariensis]SNS94954.1 maltooligosyl trehalose hydrolase [Pontibacter ummariensis]
MSILREIGGIYHPDKGTTFTVWAPEAELVEVVLHQPEKKTLPLQREAFGYWTGLAEDAGPGSLYTFKINKEIERPDPASHFQPEGVHQASAVVDHSGFEWTDQQWKGLPLEQLLIYELHVGTFTEEGTFEGIIHKLPELKDLGITAIELMPVAQFPGNRNWGYDGVYPFATQNSYGGPEGLKKLVNACHEQGISVVLDVVYNHMGPEGNYLNDFGPYFTDKYHTPWGNALNFDDAHSDHVRNYFFQNALMWLRDYHLDALRLDAVHAIYDTGARHFLQELREHVTQLADQQGRPYLLIAESDLSDVRLINPIEQGGYGLDAQWFDDYHHTIHTLVTGEVEGYYEDYGKPEQLQKALEKTFVYDGLYSEHRKKTLGTDASANPPQQFVVGSQNHDQVGNRMLGERLPQLVSFEMLKAVAGLVLLSPYVPMLFMGEEYAEEHPFLYFVSHTDPDLVEAVRKGRREEFSAFAWKGEAPDPQSEETFQQSKLQWSYHSNEQQNKLREFYKELIQLRKTAPALAKPSKQQMQVHMEDESLVLHLIHKSKEPYLYCLFNLSKQPQRVQLLTTEKDANWQPILHSADRAWGGPGIEQQEALQGQAEINLPAASVLVLQHQQ